MMMPYDVAKNRVCFNVSLSPMSCVKKEFKSTCILVSAAIPVLLLTWRSVLSRSLLYGELLLLLLLLVL